MPYWQTSGNKIMLDTAIQLYRRFTLLILWLLCPVVIQAANAPISLFPLENYSQNVDSWLPPNAPDYKTALVSTDYQRLRLQDLYRHVFSAASDGLSPWSKTFVTSIISNNNQVFTTQQNALTAYSNYHKSAKEIGYGENFRPYPTQWLQKIADNMQLQQFSVPLKFTANQRGIVVENTSARMLPTRDPHFYSFELAGQGYPFDNLQASALWVGTPVYIIGESKDHAWSLVMTSSFNVWVENSAIAKVTPSFVTRWNRQVQKKLAAITYTEAPVIDSTNQQWHFNAYIGTILPALSEHTSFFKIWIPLKDINGYAYVREARISKSYAAIMPMPATRENFSRLFKSLINRPYGWGGMYFYNDCSQELQSVFTPFAIWLPRNSASQVKAGNIADKSAESVQQRIAYLQQHGHPLMTSVYIGSHVFLYLGNYSNPNVNNSTMAMTYQNVWGLTPKDRSWRAVIGQAVFLPLLVSYPEDLKLTSLADKKFFKVIFLDEMPDTNTSFMEMFYQVPSS